MDIINFFNKCSWINNHSIADDTYFILIKNAGRNHRQFVFFIVDQNRMACIVSTLVTSHNICSLRQKSVIFLCLRLPIVFRLQLPLTCIFLLCTRCFAQQLDKLRLNHILQCSIISLAVRLFQSQIRKRTIALVTTAVIVRK